MYFNIERWPTSPLNNDHIDQAWVSVLSELQICELAAVLIKKRLKIIGTAELDFIETAIKL